MKCFFFWIPNVLIFIFGQKKMLDESTHDFESVNSIFQDDAQKTAFERLADYAETTHFSGHSRLCLVEFSFFLKACEAQITKHVLQRGRFPDIKSFFLNKYLEYDPYSIYIILKYIGLPEVSKKLLDSFFSRNVFSPWQMLEIYNDEFVLLFFGVDCQTNIKKAVELLGGIEKLCGNLLVESHIYDIANRVARYIFTYNIIRLRVKFSYFVTQNIIFDKTDFTKDFYMRYTFAGAISAFYNLKIFSITIESPHIFEALWHRLTEFIKEPELPATIRKTFHDLYSDAGRKWVFCNYAKKLDASSLADFLVPHRKCRARSEARSIYACPEAKSVEYYLNFIRIYDDITANIDKQWRRKCLDGHEAEFAAVIYRLRNMVPYELIRLLEFRSHLQSTLATVDY